MLFNVAVKSLPDTDADTVIQPESETFLYSNPLLEIDSPPAFTVPRKTAEVWVIELAGKVVTVAQFGLSFMVPKKGNSTGVDAELYKPLVEHGTFNVQF